MALPCITSSFYFKILVCSWSLLHYILLLYAAISSWKYFYRFLICYYDCYYYIKMFLALNSTPNNQHHQQQVNKTDKHQHLTRSRCQTERSGPPGADPLSNTEKCETCYRCVRVTAVGRKTEWEKCSGGMGSRTYGSGFSGSPCQ